MTSFIALYRGRTVGDATLIAVSADPKVVAAVSRELLSRSKDLTDKIVHSVETGRRVAIQMISEEATDAQQCT